MRGERHSDDSIRVLAQPGDVVEICFPFFKHYAIVCDREVDGFPTLISLSRRNGSVVEEPWRRATEGRPVRLSPIRGVLPGAEVVARARACATDRDFKWNLLTNNCEHFVYYAHGLPVQSAQIRRSLAGALVGAASAVLLPRISLARVVLMAGTGALSNLLYYVQKRP